MKIVFAASDYIALPLLEALSKRNLIALVLTSPDAPGKRGKALLPSPIKKRALELGLNVYTPSSLKKAEREEVASYGADTLLSFCYGKIFGPKFLSIFSHTMNVHPSALPLYRGCSPIYNTIKDRVRDCSIALQEIALGVDEGRLYETFSFPLKGDETEETLSLMISEYVPDLVLRNLQEIDSAIPYEQKGDASYTSFVRKEDGAIDFSKSAEEIHALIRASYPWPKAYASLNDEKLYITGVYGSAFEPFEATDEVPGTIIALDKAKGLKVATGSGILYITRVLPPAKKEMDAKAYANGQKNLIGSILR